MESLHDLSPLDGRYINQVKDLRQFFSESALIRYRVFVELRYLAALSGVGACRELSKDELDLLRAIEGKLTDEECAKIKAFEQEVNHDVKACEYWLKYEFKNTSLQDLTSMIHFGLTSYDINDTAYALMLKNAITEVMVPVAEKMLAVLRKHAIDHASLAMLGRTHGQPATPTTLGKEFAVFTSRFQALLAQLKAFVPTTKFNGATGNFNALALAAPNVDWIAFSTQFIQSLGVQATLLTTQIEPKDALAHLCNIFRSLNNITIDLSRDCWLYISHGYLSMNSLQTDVGSSTMPHKVNPIRFENAEGNLEFANAMLTFFSDKLTKSRLQRDLSDSTVLRNLGVAFGHTLIGWKSCVKGLSEIIADEEMIQQDLSVHPEILTEAIQTVLRKHGVEDAYEQLRDFSKGEKITLESLRDFISKLDIPPEVKKALMELEPQHYVGLAPELARSVQE